MEQFRKNCQAAWRVILSLNSKDMGMVYLASPPFYMKDAPLEIIGRYAANASD